MATALVLDRDIAEQVMRERRERGLDRFDEVWEGVYVVSPLASIEHQHIAGMFTCILSEVIQNAGLGRVFPGANVSDREGDWKQNFRAPDVVVVLKGSRARDCDTHFYGGPDFLVEVLSQDDKSYDKIEFYAKIGVRELLIVDPPTRRAELFRLSGTELALVGVSAIEDQKVVESEVVPLKFETRREERKAQLLVTRTDSTVGSWKI